MRTTVTLWVALCDADGLTLTPGYRHRCNGRGTYAGQPVVCISGAHRSTT